MVTTKEGIVMARRSQNIYKRKDGRYEGRYIKDRTPSGRAVYGYVYAKTYRDIKDKLELAKSSVGNNDEKFDTTVGEAVRSYIDDNKNNIKESTYILYTGYYKRYIKDSIGALQCSKLTRDNLQGFIDELAKNLSPGTVSLIYSFLKYSLQYVSKRGKNISNSVFDVNLPKKDRQNINPLTKQEQRKIEETIYSSNNANSIGILLCLYTGIRIGELCGLKWEDVDLESRTITICRTVQRVKTQGGAKKTKVILTSPKSSSSIRKIPIQSFLADILKQYRQKSYKREFVFESKSGMTEPRYFQYLFKSLLKESGVRNVNFHITRHTFATRALESGFDIKTLSEILGHSSPAITLSKYAHCIDDYKRKKMEELADLYSS